MTKARYLLYLGYVTYINKLYLHIEGKVKIYKTILRPVLINGAEHVEINNIRYMKRLSKEPKSKKTLWSKGCAIKFVKRRKREWNDHIT